MQYHNPFDKFAAEMITSLEGDHIDAGIFGCQTVPGIGPPFFFVSAQVRSSSDPFMMEIEEYV